MKHHPNHAEQIRGCFYIGNCKTALTVSNVSALRIRNVNPISQLIYLSHEGTFVPRRTESWQQLCCEHTGRHLEAIWWLALKDTELANAYVGTIRLKPLMIGAIILRNTRCIRFLLSSAYPYQPLFAHVTAKLQPT